MEKGKLISQGRTAEIFEWGNKEVVKLYRQGIHYEAIENEYNISTMMNDKGISTPYTVKMVKIDERYGIIYEKVIGKTMISVLTTKPWTITRQAQNLADLHYSMHTCTIGGIQTVKEKLRRDINGTDLLDDNKKNIILGYLNNLEDGNALCHGDFHPDNVLVAKNRTLVIDWMTGGMGSPMADAARTHILLSIGTVPPGTSKIKEKLIENVRSKFHDEYLSHYLTISGAFMEEVERWILPVAAARLSEWLPMSEKEKLIKIIEEKLRDIA